MPHFTTAIVWSNSLWFSDIGLEFISIDTRISLRAMFLLNARRSELVQVCIEYILIKMK